MPWQEPARVEKNMRGNLPTSSSVNGARCARDHTCASFHSCAAAGPREVILRMVLSRAPKLIPLVAHRFLPETPHEAGNPVVSVYQSDIIYYAANLDDFFNQEFEGWKDWPLSDQKINHIPFWSDFAERIY
jgi:hypothetical protein